MLDRTRRRRWSPAGRSRVAAALSLIALAACTRPQPLPEPPETEVEPVVDTYHGVEVTDPYRWLEDQESAETRQWIEAQNAYTDQVLSFLPAQEELQQRIAALYEVEEVSLPTVRGERYFFKRRGADQDLYVLYMRQGADGEDQVLIDPHPLSDDRTTSVDLVDVSQDGRLLAYAVREGGEDEVTLRFFDVESRAERPDVLERGLYYGGELTPDGGGFYYTRQTAEGPRVFHHRLGSDPGEDRLLFGEGYGPEKILFASLSEDGRWLLAQVFYGSSADQTEVHLRDLAADGGWITVVDDLEARFQAGIGGDQLYLGTNWQAPNGRVLAADLAAPADRAAWREVVPEQEGSVIESISLAGGRLFVNYLEEVHSRVAVYAPDGTPLEEIAFDTLGSITSVQGEWGQPEAFFLFTSFHVPETVYRYQVETGERQVWHRSQAPVDPERFELHQVWYTSKDGTRVPMFLLHQRGLELDGSRPVLLTGYGGFTASMTPEFGPTPVVWAEHGGVYALANLRGGAEFGEEWHRAGMRESKQNVFDDFIAAARWLIDQGYTRPEKLAIWGGSNGGLLVGAAMTQQPALFEAVVCTYPLLDMLRYQKFLMGPYWVPEYGSAEESPEMFQALRAYSPYHNVQPGTDYPAVLFITGDSDTRVAPLHARKMTALMQTVAVGESPVLLRYHEKAGHSGGQPISERVKNLAEGFRFLFWRLGVEG